MFWLGILTFTVSPPLHPPLGAQGELQLRERHLPARYRDREVFSSCLSGHPTPRPQTRTFQPGLSSAAGVSQRLSLSTLPGPRLSFSLECISPWEATTAAPDWIEGQGFLVFVAASVSPSVNCVRKVIGHQGSPQSLTCSRSLSSSSAGSALGAAAEGTPDRPQRTARVGVRAAAARAPLFPRPCPSACSLGFALGPGRRDSSSCGRRLLVS